MNKKNTFALILILTLFKGLLSESMGENITLPELIAKSDCIVFGKVDQISPSYYKVKTLKALKGKYAREYKVERSEAEDSLRSRPLAMDDGMLLFLKQATENKVFRAVQSPLLGEVLVEEHQAYFAKGLLDAYENRKKTPEEIADEEDEAYERSEEGEAAPDTAGPFRKMNYENIAKGINLYLKIFGDAKSIDISRYNALMVNNESDLSVEEKMLLRYGHLFYQ